MVELAGWISVGSTFFRCTHEYSLLKNYKEQLLSIPQL